MTGFLTLAALTAAVAVLLKPQLADRFAEWVYLTGQRHREPRRHH